MNQQGELISSEILWKTRQVWKPGMLISLCTIASRFFISSCGRFNYLKPDDCS